MCTSAWVKHISMSKSVLRHILGFVVDVCVCTLYHQIRARRRFINESPGVITKALYN